MSISTRRVVFRLCVLTGAVTGTVGALDGKSIASSAATAAFIAFGAPLLGRSLGGQLGRFASRFDHGGVRYIKASPTREERPASPPQVP
jgi:hypothetical protein